MHGANNFAFIDGTNLHYTYEKPENLGWEIDYSRLILFLKAKYNVTFAYYFLGKIGENSRLYRELESYGYHLKLKTPSKYTTQEEYCPYCLKSIAPELSRYKSDCDSFMTLEVISAMPSYDEAVIITSDGDFDELIKELVRKNRLRLLLAPCKDGCSGLLKSAAGGRIAFMDDFRNALEKT
jgi:uncharacterized LabA/DUF88 family protein